MTSRPFNVDMPGLLRVFGGHLYSTPAVFLRELVQNGVDAIVARRLADPRHVGRVQIRGNIDEHVVVVEDDGVGLDEAGIEQCLARIGSSSKTAGSDFLGHFGIGLLSSFLVANEVIVDTLCEGGAPLQWRARADGTYQVEPGNRHERGTTVRLHLTDEHRHFAKRDTIRALCLEYVRYLPFVVEHDGARVTEPAPWLVDDSGHALRAWLGQEPLALLPLPSGAMWISRARSVRGARVDVYNRGMLLVRGAADLLPPWATFVSGVVDAPQLAPTASRETFVEDANAAALRDSLRRGLLTGLKSLAAEPGAASEFASVLAIHYVELRGACVESRELLDAIGAKIPFSSNVGMVDLARVAEASRSNIIHYVDTPQDFAHTSQLASAQGIILLDASYVHDKPFLDAYARLRGMSLLRMSSHADALVTAAPELAMRFAAVLSHARDALEPFGVAPEIGRFEPGALPAFLLADALGTEERSRRLEKTTSSPLVRRLLAAKRDEANSVRFILNVNNPLVMALPDAKNQEYVRRVARLLYAHSSIMLRRSLSSEQTQAFSDDLLALLQLNPRHGQVH